MKNPKNQTKKHTGLVGLFATISSSTDPLSRTVQVVGAAFDGHFLVRTYCFLPNEPYIIQVVPQSEMVNWIFYDNEAALKEQLNYHYDSNCLCFPPIPKGVPWEPKASPPDRKAPRVA